VAVTKALMAAPGPLGRELVLPWALAGLPHNIPPSEGLDGDLLEQAVNLSRDLTAHVWDRPEDEALIASAQVLDRLRGVGPSAAVEAIASLRQPDQAQAGVLLGILAEIGERLVSDGLLSNADMMWYFNVEEVRAAIKTRRHLGSRRVGVQPWEPLVASVVLDTEPSSREFLRPAGLEPVSAMQFSRLQKGRPRLGV